MGGGSTRECVRAGRISSASVSPGSWHRGEAATVGAVGIEMGIDRVHHVGYRLLQVC